MQEVDRQKVENLELLPIRAVMDEVIALLRLKQHYEAQMKRKFDPVLSRKLDCIQYLLEN